jgi:DNA-binding MarR family transcriptional regulator
MTRVERALSADHEKAWRGWLRAHALLVRALDDDLRAEHGITLLTYDALVQLSEAPGRQLYMKDLAHALVYSASGVTRVVDGLERAGYAHRSPDPHNRRATRVSLTPAGLAALEAAWPTHVRGVTEHFAAHTSSNQARTLAAAFRAIITDLESPAG